MRRRREPSVVRSEGRPSRRDEQAFREEMGNAEFADAVEKILMWSTSATQAQRDLEEQFRRRIERHQKQQHQQQQASGWKLDVGTWNSGTGTAYLERTGAEFNGTGREVEAHVARGQEPSPCFDLMCWLRNRDCFVVAHLSPMPK